MYRLTARVLLVLLLAGMFVPVAVAVSAPLPHACCMRKPMRDRGSLDGEMRAVEGGQNRSCCPPVTTAHWAELGTGFNPNIHPQLAYLSPAPQPLLNSNHWNALQPVRGPPLN